MQKLLKILHMADFHYSRENQEKALKSLNTVCDKAEKEEVNLIVIAGNLFDRPVNNTESSGFFQLINTMQWMMNTAPVVAVTGTVTHDIPGCYEVFKDIESIHGFKLLSPTISYFLHDRIVNDEDISPDLLLFGIPEVSKQWFLKGRQLGPVEADEAIKEGMRVLLLGLGATRKQYPDIPSLLLYHGMISGSTLSNNHVMHAGGIQLGKEDLSIVGADYYALGHVHKPQQIDSSPAFYSGSTYPVDWGETDQKGFNLITIKGENDLSVQFISYPHPPRKVIEIDFDLSVGEKPEYPNMRGYEVWIKIKASKDKAHTLIKKKDQILIEIIEEDGALTGSRIDVFMKPTETIRSKEITEVTSLQDKVKVYSELSGLLMNDETEKQVLQKAETLELTTKEEGIITEGLHIRMKKLILRGAIGIHKGINKDQIEIDIDQYDPGLIALIGRNGSGKTTLIENMHPYPQMLTRAGKLQDHFYLKDSFRDLYFIDERTRTEYRAFMAINGANKSGSVEYFLYRKEDGIFKPASTEINGRQSPYVIEVERLFGSLPLFLRSAFVSQKQPKNLPDLSEATKGEKKALFRELGGLDYLHIYSDAAKEKWQILDRELIRDRSSIENLERDTAALPERKKEMLLLGSTKEAVESS